MPVVRTHSTTVFACHSAACRPPTSGGTGGSSPGPGGPKDAPWNRAHVPGKWDRVGDSEDEQFSRFCADQGFPGPRWSNTTPEFMREVFDMNKPARDADRAKGDYETFCNGPLKVLLPKNMDPAATQRLMSRLDALYQRFPTVAPRVGVIVADSLGTPSTWGSTYLPKEGDVLAVIRLKRNIVEGEESPREFGADPGYFQNSVPVSAAEWTTTHEWGHATDRRTLVSEPSSLYQNGSRPGLSIYGTTNKEEAYAESFADWVTSGGKSTNEATRLYALQHKWPVP